jgi:hypothetical protein
MPPIYFLSRLPTQRNFALGIQIGVCATIALVGLLVSLTLYGIYWTQWSNLLSAGVNAALAENSLQGIAYAMGLCVYAVILASYILFRAITIQLNPTMQALMSKGFNRARLGDLFVYFGVLMLGIAAMDYFMFLNHHSFLDVMQVFGGIGLVCLPIGVLLLASARLKSGRLATKV